MKIISGGQTGADRGALEAARECGFETGGIAPIGFATERGRDYELMRMGLTELHRSPAEKHLGLAWQYAKRTEENVRNSDATLIFARDFDSKGTKLTRRYVRDAGKTWRMVNPFIWQFEQMSDEYVAGIVNWILMHDVKVLNVAGNRESKAPGIGAKVREIMTQVLTRYRDE